MRNVGIAKATVIWRSLLRMFPGPTESLIEKLGATRGNLQLEMMLRKWSHKTVIRHARAVNTFIDWLNTAGDGIMLLDPTQVTAEEAISRLVDYMHFLVDAEVGPTVPRSRLHSLAFFARFAGIEEHLPTDDVAVTTVADSYFRDNKKQQVKARPYTVREVQLIEKAAKEHQSTLVRIALRNELRKLYGGLRNDDSIWTTPSEWQTAGELPHMYMYGKAEKTKATEQTATRLAGGMPWVIPLRGVSPEPSRWADGYTADLERIGILHLPYAVPSPWNFRAGIKPPGLASDDEWITQVRFALTEAGLAASRAKQITLHSAKVTILTWIGLSDRFKDTDRAILGHHRSPGVNGTVRGYTWNELAGPVRKLTDLLEDIAKGKFIPDALPGLQWALEGPGPEDFPLAQQQAEDPDFPVTQRDLPASGPAEQQTSHKRDDPEGADVADRANDLHFSADYDFCFQCLQIFTPLNDTDRIYCPECTALANNVRKSAVGIEDAKEACSTATPELEQFGADRGMADTARDYVDMSAEPTAAPPLRRVSMEDDVITPTVPMSPRAPHADGPEDMHGKNNLQDGIAGVPIMGTCNRDLGYLVPTGGHKGNKRGFYHVARSIKDVGPERCASANGGRLIIHVGSNMVTNLCDFRIGSAVLAATPPEGYTICKVCNSRQRRGL